MRSALHRRRNLINLLKYVPRPHLQEFFSKLHSKGLGSVNSTSNGVFYNLFPVRGGNESNEIHLLILNFPVGSNGYLAPSLKPSEKRPLCPNRDGSRTVVKKYNKGICFFIVCPCFYAERPLAYGRKAYLRRDIFSYPVRPSKPLYTSSSQNNGIKPAIIQFFQSCIKIASQLRYL